MNNKFSRAVMLSQKINRKYIRLFFAMVTIIMLVLGAGAPNDGGHVGF